MPSAEKAKVRSGKACPRQQPTLSLAARRRVYRADPHGHDADRRARQTRLERTTPIRSSPRKRGPRGRGSGLGVPGLASLARDTKSRIPAFAGMNGEGVTRIIDEKDVMALLDARRRKYDLSEHAQRHRRQRGEQ